MSYYNRGLALPMRIASQEHYRIGTSLVATPGAIKDEAIRLNADIETMDAELGAERTTWLAELTDEQQVMDHWWQTAWVPFLREWSTWFSDHGRTSGLRLWWENFWGASWEQAQDFRRKLLALRESAQHAGFHFIAPTPAPPKQGPIDKLGEGFWKIIKVVLIVGGVLLGGWLVIRYMEAP